MLFETPEALEMETTQEILDWVNDNRNAEGSESRSEISYHVGNLAADRERKNNAGRALNAQAETLRMLSDLGGVYLYQKRYGDPIRIVDPKNNTRTIVVYDYLYLAKRSRDVILPIIGNRQQLKSVHERKFPQPLTSTSFR
jgi:hypothetical protein